MKKGTSLKITIIGTVTIICSSYLLTPNYRKNNEKLEIKNMTKFLEFINQEELAHQYQEKQFIKQLKNQGYDVISCQYGNYNVAKYIRKYDNTEIGYEDYDNGQIIPYVKDYDEIHLPIDITYTDWDRKGQLISNTSKTGTENEKYILKKVNDMYVYNIYTRDSIVTYDAFNDDIIFDNMNQVPGYEMEYVITDSENEKKIEKTLYYQYTR